MAKEDEKKPTTAEKGKGKAVNGDAEKKEVLKDKDGKPIDPKKDAPAAGMLRNRCCHITAMDADTYLQKSSAKRISN
jgi:hypothetical protein